MICTVIKFLSLMMLVAGSIAGVAFGPSPVHPDHPGQCWSTSQNKNYADGSCWQEPNCVQVTCSSYKNNLYLQYATCPRIGVSPGCTTTQDLTLPYPNCCPLPSCPPASNPTDLLGDDYADFTNWISEFYDYAK